MPDVSWVMLLVNAPVPEPSEVLLLAIVGFSEEFQHTPLELTAAFPSLVTFPPVVAVVCEIPVTVVVVTTGVVGFFLHEAIQISEQKKRVITRGILNK